MSLRKSVGNMYPWVTHTHSHLGGECPHQCAYCYVKNFPFRPVKYQGELRLIDKELLVNYGDGKTIFIENCNDLFEKSVSPEFIKKILLHCKEYQDNTYVFQSKNPERILYMGKQWWPENNIIGTTIESNRHYPHISNAPAPVERATAMISIEGRKFITIEPVLDFDVDILASWIDRIRPEFLNLGADSKGHGLPEPTMSKIIAFTQKLKDYGIELREKHNLLRLTTV